jgi:hypothetical protein
MQTIEDFYIVALAYAPVLLGLGASIVGPPIFLERYLVFAHTFFLAAVAIACARLTAPPMFGVVATALAFNNAFAMAFETGYVTRETGSLRLIASLLREKCTPGDIVLIHDPGLFNQMWYLCWDRTIPVRLRLLNDIGQTGLHRANAASIPAPMMIREEDVDAMTTPFLLISKDKYPATPAR